MENQTFVSYFLLLEFSKDRHLQLLHFFLFFILYLAVTSTNLLIISAIAFDHQLHSPMYLFLLNLAVQDVGIVSAIIPKSMINSLMDTRHISYFGCFAQVLIFSSFEASDLFLLTVMAYDRYVAICHPLHYELIMNWKACTKIVVLVWVTSLLYGMLHTIGTFYLSFCSNVVNQFFCEIPHLLKLSCFGFNLVEVGFLIVSIITLGLGCVIYIIVSYTRIFMAVLRIPSVKGRQKTFSTCLPHLTVFSVFLVTVCLAYLKPPSNTQSYLDFTLTALYSFLPPVFNPIIYSIRNKNIKSVLYKLWHF
ncbi:olfactory receptor 14A2-like [Crotalus tigris]|uniref:olfactory receptor 14A2-like n=1 Tax=Crotalus tigris TaxID=88082 RepID=UPI00192F5B7C|nr:olfactory receptor 14A2-like [Crotalus tigris]XP_039185150.1 olfactory receptor 14A2-like [Crotalus tigris]XP_039185151.1 olfactory receptor 14A2-like [Crotalus tigris]